ncbi:DUF418 domain-containing protein [Streptomyces sp. RP5T]|uniref:DUF418 domain-containing protein n=1 Tax=Streptomyces sp. RP5T TaxID=2490848 RepID=UPI0021ADBE46|nr:DUF418 domain-containing protein [Streptomyces sp. RP5T]
MRFSSFTSTRASADSARTETTQGNRVQEVDILRGFALLGILLVNSLIMAGPHLGPQSGSSVGSHADNVAEWLVTALVTTKFYLLFSFLFGYSFTLQRAAADRAGKALAPRHLRRLSCLLLLGLVHGVLLFPGDVLMVYAVLSLLLFALRNTSPRTALWTAAGLVACAAACLLAWGLLTVAYSQPMPTGAFTTALERTSVARRATPGSVVSSNLQWLRDTLGWEIIYGSDMLAAILVGMIAGRSGVLASPYRYRKSMIRIVVLALPFGLTGSAFMAVCRNGPLDPRWYDVGSAVGLVTAPTLTAAYACGLLLLLPTRAGRRVADMLAPAGRMALTNYLTQSMVMALVFTGYGLAQYGRYSTAVVLTGCFVLYTTQLVVSRWLMGRVRYGPVEWLLRMATLARKP